MSSNAIKSFLMILNNQRTFRLKAVSVCLALVAWVNAAAVAPAQSQSALKVSADAFVAWWMHDATGYHPAIYLILQNTSGVDLSWKPIKFQGLFRDLRNGYVTVARDEIRKEFHPNQQLYLLLEGPKAFELPIDKNSWPTIECKVMSRVGSVDDDEATQDVLITKLEQEAMTDEEARVRLLDYSHPRMISRQSKHHQAPPPPEQPARPAQPLMATALPLAAANRPKKHGSERVHESLTHILAAHEVAGLGDDYYNFEQSFGKPVDFAYANDIKWTWARYKNMEPQFTLFAGSRGHSSKADFIVAVVPAETVQQEGQMLALGRALSGKLKSQPLSGATKTVKYLNSGRIQLSTASAPSYKLFLIAPRGASGEENTYVLGICRVAGDPRLILADNARRVPMLRNLFPVVADQGAD